MLAFFASVPYVIYRNNVEERSIEAYGEVVLSLFMILLFLGGLVAIVVFTKVITIYEENQRVIILHPFFLRRRVYSFSEIIGFRWVSLHGRITYQSIKLKAKSGKVFQFSDFEVDNFRDIEGIFLQNFELRCGKDWKSVSDKGKKNLLNTRRNFDFNQAKDIKDYVRLGIISVVAFLLAIFYKIYQDSFVVEILEVMLMISLMLALYGLIIKLRSINKQLESYK